VLINTVLTGVKPAHDPPGTRARRLNSSARCWPLSQSSDRRPRLNVRFERYLAAVKA